MRVFVKWGIWGLPFGFSTGGPDGLYSWAFTVGPVHFVRPKELNMEDAEMKTELDGDLRSVLVMARDGCCDLLPAGQRLMAATGRAYALGWIEGAGTITEAGRAALDGA